MVVLASTYFAPCVVVDYPGYRQSQLDPKENEGHLLTDVWPRRVRLEGIT
jgi:hypothetical protein